MSEDLFHGAAVQVECSFCKGKLVLGHDVTGEPMILHTMPFCPRFEIIETPDEMLVFLADNRKNLGITDDEEPS